ncbi:MAG: 50S ribosomal protein L21 [Dehalococcoidia bacterium]|nr:50S ribosomal protein L21 [Dehalococcoidia bacterium]MEC7920563.1 50S ribosomal protein L21 [Chloroflexota bacterium]MEC9451526.1 50S ribosomal protein L21 [Chloroflexota bacterium]|tara:strand:- start:176 stop:553 length:378 start_codon:yes stop_codon:yes gene_type:complete
MNDYAVIKTGGKQYLVEQGTKINVEKLEGKPGEKITFDDVLMTSISGKVVIGKPVVKNSKVVGEIEDQFKGPKVKGIRYKNKTRHTVRIGHRQNLTSIIIKDLGKATSTKKKAAPKKTKGEKDGS